MPTSRTIEVLVDIELDEKRSLLFHDSLEDARKSFLSVKDDILKLLRDKDYDNYVTGGGTNKTQKFYQNKKNEYESMGIFIKHIYEEKEVDINLV